MAAEAFSSIDPYMNKVSKIEKAKYAQPLQEAVQILNKTMTNPYSANFTNRTTRKTSIDKYDRLQAQAY